LRSPHSEQNGRCPSRQACPHKEQSFWLLGIKLLMSLPMSRRHCRDKIYCFKTNVYSRTLTFIKLVLRLRIQPKV
jgi:hypothetical protein